LLKLVPFKQYAIYYIVNTENLVFDFVVHADQIDRLILLLLVLLEVREIKQIIYQFIHHLFTHRWILLFLYQFQRKLLFFKVLVQKHHLNQVSEKYLLLVLLKIIKIHILKFVNLDIEIYHHKWIEIFRRDIVNIHKLISNVVQQFITYIDHLLYLLNSPFLIIMFIFYLLQIVIPYFISWIVHLLVTSWFFFLFLFLISVLSIWLSFKSINCWTTSTKLIYRLIRNYELLFHQYIADLHDLIQREIRILIRNEIKQHFSWKRVLNTFKERDLNFLFLKFTFDLILQTLQIDLSLLLNNLRFYFNVHLFNLFLDFLTFDFIDSFSNLLFILVVLGIDIRIQIFNTITAIVLFSKLDNISFNDLHFGQIPNWWPMVRVFLKHQFNQ